MSKMYKALAANSNDSSFPARIATVTTPSGLSSNTFNPGVSDETFVTGVRNSVVFPYGVGNDDTTFSLRIIGWSQTSGGLWIPTILCEVTCILCTSVGVAGQDVVATERFCDTIALVTNLGNANVSVEIISPQNNTPGHIMLDTKGCNYLDFIFDMTGATSGNALVGLL